MNFNYQYELNKAYRQDVERQSKTGCLPVPIAIVGTLARLSKLRVRVYFTD